MNRKPSVPSGFYRKVVDIIKIVPRGRVATYGQIADYAGFRGAARQVAYVLHSSSEKENLPWHRVINKNGGISLKRGAGYELQKKLLEDEGVCFGIDDRIDLARFLWHPSGARP